jgi:DNA-binding MarR family transcriptional regulator
MMSGLRERATAAIQRDPRSGEDYLQMAKRQTRGDSPFAYDGLDRLIHERARLSVLTSLVSNVHGLTFNELKDLCALTDGNLSRHLQVLETAGLVSLLKGVENNRPLTLCRITVEGRRRYVSYLQVLEQIVTDASAAIADASAERALPNPK